MATIEFKGIDEYAKVLAKVGQGSKGIIKAAVYEGADVVADAMRNAVSALPVISEQEAIIDWRQHRPSDGITAAQKQGLASGLGLSPMKDEGGYIFTKAGFAGYNGVYTKAYSNGQPNALIARSLESGSSARKKHPFIRPAVNRAKAAAEARMGAKLDEMLSKIVE